MGDRFHEQDIDGFVSVDVDKLSSSSNRPNNDNFAYVHSPKQNANPVKYAASIPVYTAPPGPPASMRHRAAEQPMHEPEHFQHAQKRVIIENIHTKVTSNNTFMAPQFFVDSRARFFNLVCLLNICVILITSAAAIGAIVLVQFEYKFSLGTFRWFLVAGMIALVIGASVGVVLFSKDNALFSIWHSANINSPLIWGCILFFAATLMLQNYVSNNGTTIHTHNVELYTKLTNIMTIFIIAAVLPLAFAISSFLSHWRAERVSPEYMVFLGMSKGQVESSRQVELAKELYDAAMSG